MPSPLEAKKQRHGWMVSVERHQFRNSSWYVMVDGWSHRLWKVSLSETVTQWLTRYPEVAIREDFIHDDYLCFFHFTFQDEVAATEFIEFMGATYGDQSEV